MPMEASPRFVLGTFVLCSTILQKTHGTWMSRARERSTAEIVTELLDIFQHQSFVKYIIGREGKC